MRDLADLALCRRVVGLHGFVAHALQAQAFCRGNLAIRTADKAFHQRDGKALGSLCFVGCLFGAGRSLLGRPGASFFSAAALGAAFLAGAFFSAPSFLAAGFLAAGFFLRRVSRQFSLRPASWRGPFPQPQPSLSLLQPWFTASLTQNFLHGFAALGSHLLGAHQAEQARSWWRSPRCRGYWCAGTWCGYP